MTIQRGLRLVEVVNVAWMAIFVLMPAIVLGVFVGLKPSALGIYLEFSIIVQFAIALGWAALYAVTLRQQLQATVDDE